MSGNFRLSLLKPKYEQLFASCQLRKSWLDRITSIAQKIVGFRPHYDVIERETTVPWWFVGILHYRALNFANAHLYNGDPLTGRTVRPPAGRPFNPPANGHSYTFAESAIDAFRWQQFDKDPDRSLAAWLWRFDLWNGFRYWERGINSEYIWNGTNHFGSGNNRGKYLPNGAFDPNGESEQVGAGAILWYFYHQGMLNGNTSTMAVPGQSQVVNQLVSAIQSYSKLPQQDAAIAWLQQQQSPAVLQEFTRRWREDKGIIQVPTTTPVQVFAGTTQSGNSAGLIKIRVLNDTFFKASTQQSSQLNDWEKILIRRGTEFQVVADEPAPGNHVEVVLANAIGQLNRNKWYIFMGHIEIEGSEPENRPQEQAAPNTTKISVVKTGPFQLPGYNSTFYLSDPVISGGHFSWAEATKNGTRIPVDKSIVEGIIKIAHVMEEVREYLGNRPITINSWYRDPASNRKAGGASRSRHMSGDAVDFVVQGLSPPEVHKRIEPWWGNRGGVASASCFTHIDARGYKARWRYGF